MLNRILGLFSHDIGIDLGTANVLVLVRGKGIVVREPSVVAIHQKTKDILAIGSEAKKMIGKTPASIRAVRPLRSGVISDFDLTEVMLNFFIKKVHQTPSFSLKFPRPRVVIGVPSGVTEVERRAVIDAAREAGAREAYLLEEPMAAAIGAELPIEEAAGSMIVDIGGGTTEVAVVSLGGIVINKSLRVAGDEMDQGIVNFAKERFNLLVGERTAEEVKIQIGAALPNLSQKEAVMRGRDLKTGLPKSIKVSSSDLAEALYPTLKIITTAIKDTIEETPPELIADLMQTEITLAGGGSLLLGIDKLIANETAMPVKIADDPQTCVVRGCGAVLENIRLLQRVRIV